VKDGEGEQEKERQPPHPCITRKSGAPAEKRCKSKACPKCQNQKPGSHVGTLLCYSLAPCCLRMSARQQPKAVKVSASRRSVPATNIRPMKRIFSMRLEDWNTVLQFASAILLGLTFAVGAGAIFTGYLIGKRQEVRIAATEQGTAEANKKAAEAGEGTAKALAQVAAANERATKLEFEAAQQRERAAKAEHDLLDLQQRLASRRIAPKEHAALVSALKPHRGAVVEVTKLGDLEAGQFAHDILSVLAEAGWNVQTNFVGTYSPPRYGLICRINDSTPAGKALVAALKSLPTVALEANSHLPINASIFVGLRPPP